jgi:hypothetical protein
MLCIAFYPFRTFLIEFSRSVNAFACADKTEMNFGSVPVSPI